MARKVRPSIVLASASPRRALLLEQIGVPFEIRVPQIDEAVLADEPPGQYVERMARAKATQVQSSGRVTIGADTAVVAGGRILGKPAGREDAIRMLSLLAGRTHQVFTAVAITDGRDTRSSTVVTNVTFRELEPAEMSAYWETGEPSDKAGGYGIQGIGGIFAANITGSYSAVVGLPLAETERLLVRFGVDTWCCRVHD